MINKLTRKYVDISYVGLTAILLYSLCGIGLEHLLNKFSSLSIMPLLFLLAHFLWERDIAFLIPWFLESAKYTH